MYMSWHFTRLNSFISATPVVEQGCFLPSDIFLLPNQTINFLLFVPGSLMKIPGKISPKAWSSKSMSDSCCRTWNSTNGMIRFHMPLSRIFHTRQPLNDSLLPCACKNSPRGSLYETLYSSPVSWEPEHCLPAEPDLWYNNKGALS